MFTAAVRRAGLDKSARPEIFERGIILTSSSGRSAPALAEHALMFMLSLTYDTPAHKAKLNATVRRISPEFAINNLD